VSELTLERHILKSFVSGKTEPRPPIYVSVTTNLLQCRPKKETARKHAAKETMHSQHTH